ncbi:hypothetical protein [Phytohabitans aurantiacus]|uniref:Uncharacterized protein n=1 Tax=Phytohabitans aurantiacus TaxID=3016789 RepID=A0ABQ5QQZ1_9ACTN|nr:hypothetical protein [Phytohabitans aurantiacus]GLH96282.1 hypothetical protein Pa4123_15560 [Phytohabitans aurantiacus]
MNEWIATLDELLLKPFETGGGSAPEPHHVDLRVSQDFWDDETRDEVFGPVLAEFEADRARLAQAISVHYGVPQRKDLRPYFDDNPPDEPGSALFEYLAGWFFEVDVWQVGARGIVAEVGHQDKELPLQLMLVVGDLSRVVNRGG